MREGRRGKSGDQFPALASSCPCLCVLLFSLGRNLSGCSAFSPFLLTKPCYKKKRVFLGFFLNEFFVCSMRRCFSFGASTFGHRLSPSLSLSLLLYLSLSFSVSLSPAILSFSSPEQANIKGTLILVLRS